jgi:hypothetical protein
MELEYAMQGQSSVKSDVYIFGILVLELMSGRKCVDFNLSPEMEILLEWVGYYFHCISNLPHLCYPLCYLVYNIVCLSKLYEIRI